MRLFPPPVVELFASLGRCQRKSILPRSAVFAISCAALALLVKVYDLEGKLPTASGYIDIMSDKQAYLGFATALSFLLVFRTNSSYSRYWEGISLGHRMFAEWFDFAASVVAFCRYSKAGNRKTRVFFHRFVRLLSLMHATAQAKLRGMDSSCFELIDLGGFDEEMIESAWQDKHPDALVSQWLLELVVEGIEDGVVAAPPPLVSRSFQEFANGVVAFHDALKLENSRFPLVYTQLLAFGLLAQWVMTPIVMTQWVAQPLWVFILTLIQMTVNWALYFTAVELEQPFKQGTLEDVYQAAIFQREFNANLLELIGPRTRKVPKLASRAKLNLFDLTKKPDKRDFGESSRDVLALKKAAIATKSRGCLPFPRRNGKQARAHFKSKVRSSILLEEANHPGSTSSSPHRPKAITFDGSEEDATSSAFDSMPRLISPFDSAGVQDHAPTDVTTLPADASKVSL